MFREAEHDVLRRLTSTPLVSMIFQICKRTFHGSERGSVPLTMSGYDGIQILDMEIEGVPEWLICTTTLGSHHGVLY
jgi:hypothetical protein